MKLVTVICFINIILINLAKPARPESLPKIVWTYLQNNDDNFIHSLCLHRARNILQQSRWVLQILTPTNVYIYLTEHEQHKSMIKNHKYLSFVEEMELVKLFILKQYGGIWIDPTTILLDSVDWIQHIENLTAVEKYGNVKYQMVIFSSRNDESVAISHLNQQRLKNIPINLGIILALKGSPILGQWIKQIAKQLLQYQQILKQKNYFRKISKEALTNILIDDEGDFQSSLKQNSIWKLQYNDFQVTFTKSQKQQNHYILADFYLQFSLEQRISKQSYPKYFISLNNVQKQLNEILNPNISKLEYLGNSQPFQFISPVKVECAHYIEDKSLIYNLLIKDTYFEPLIKDMINKNDRLSKTCSDIYERQWLKQALIAIKYTLYMAIAYIFIKLQILCIQLLWVKFKIFIKPKYILFRGIWKTVKNVVQYQSSNEV